MFMPSMVPSRATGLFQQQVYKSFRLAIRKASSVAELQRLVCQITQHFMNWHMSTSVQDYVILLHMAARKANQMFKESEGE